MPLRACGFNGDGDTDRLVIISRGRGLVSGGRGTLG